MQAVEQFILDQKKSISILSFLLGCILFLYLKFTVVYEIHDRNFPPSIDDSYSYIVSIDKIAKYGFHFFESISYKTITYYLKKNPSTDGKIALVKFTDQSYLTWSFFLGQFSKITGLSAEIIYKYSFYIGIVMALLVFIYFAYKFVGFEYIGFLLLSIMLFFGDGGYHGFFWVVPSFYSLIFLFFLVAILYKSMHYGRYLIFFIPFFLLIHPISFISIPTIGSMFIIKSLVSFKIDLDLLRRTSIFFLVSLIAIIIVFSLNRLGNLPKISILDLDRTAFRSDAIFQLGPKPGGAHERAVEGTVFLQRIIMLFRLVGNLSPGFIIMIIIGLLGLKSDKQDILLSFALSVGLICFSMLFFSKLWIRLVLLLNPIIYTVIGYAVYKVVFNLKDNDLFSKALGGKYGVFILLFAFCSTITPVYLRKHNLINNVKILFLYLMLTLILFTSGLVFNSFYNTKLVLQDTDYKHKVHFLPAMIIVGLMFLQIGHYQIRNIHKYVPKMIKESQLYTASYEEQSYFENNIIGRINKKENIFLYENYNKLVVNYAMLKGLYEVPSAFIISLSDVDFTKLFDKYYNVFIVLNRPNRDALKYESPDVSAAKQIERIKHNFKKIDFEKYCFQKIHKDFSIPLQIYKIEKRSC